MASNKKRGSDQYAPKPGSYSGGPAEVARHTFESLPGNPITSRQPAAKYPSEAMHSDNRRAKELIKSDPQPKISK